MRRMRQYIITVLSIVVCSVVGLTLSACDDSANSGATSGSVAIIASNRSNQQRFDLLSSEQITSAINDHMGGTFYIISADGVPRLVASIDSTSKARNSNARKKEPRKYELSVLAAMLTPAETPESDMLSALSLAASSLAHASGDRTILVVDSGVSTAGAMAFQNTGLLEPHADVDAMIERMRSAGTLPDLTGVTVRWFGLGSVEEPQPLLDTAAKNRLKNLWTKLITAANGEVVFDDAPMMKVTGEDLPVTPVPVGAFELGAAPSLEMSLPDTEVGFEADVDVLRNEEVAKSRIQEAAAQIRSSGVSEVRVTGCTSSWGTAEHRQDLSERRAEVVAGLLENNGVKVTSITGRGYECPHQVVDTNADGTPIEELMAVNRRVIIQAP